MTYDHKPSLFNHFFGWKVKEPPVEETYIRFNTWIKFNITLPTQAKFCGIRMFSFNAPHNKWLEKCKLNEWTFISIIDKVRPGIGDNKIGFKFWGNQGNFKMHIAHMSFEFGQLDKTGEFKPQRKQSLSNPDLRQEAQILSATIDRMKPVVSDPQKE